MQLKSHSPKFCRGFNLIEVMVALIVISVGLLGIARMQALAMASTATAKTRSIAALEAAGLASALRADRNYWSAITTNKVKVTFTNGAIASTAGDANLQAAVTAAVACNSAAAPCSSVQIAAYDLNDWVTNSLAPQMPTHQVTLTCTPQTGAVVVPVTCSILMTWSENRVGVNAQSDGTQLPVGYNLYVEP